MAHKREQTTGDQRKLEFPHGYVLRLIAGDFSSFDSETLNCDGAFTHDPSRFQFKRLKIRNE